jgi:hypothetical protein
MTTCKDNVTRYRVRHADGATTILAARSLLGAKRAIKERKLEGTLEKSTDCWTWQAIK